MEIYTYIQDDCVVTICYPTIFLQVAGI